MSWHFDLFPPGGSWRWRTVKMRLFGIGFLAMGLVHFIAGAYFFVSGLITPPSDGSSPFFGLIFVASGMAGMAIGWWFCRKQSYRPDLGDVNPMLGKAGGYDEEYAREHRLEARSWWTGDPLPSNDRDRISRQRR